MRRFSVAAPKLACVADRTGKPPDEVAIASHLGVRVDKLRADYANAEALRFDSIDEVYANDTPDAFAQLAESDLRHALVRAIATVPAREAQVIQVYHVEEMNLDEIGLVLGFGAARVCQLKKATHDRMRAALKAER